jgi:hypothetical protein
LDRLLVLHLIVCAFLCGLIWVVQLVHYPLFDRVDRAMFPSFESAHSTRITWVVAPVMLAEAATAVLLLVTALRAGADARIAMFNLAGVVAIWAATAFLSVPQHARLADGFDPEAHRLLVQTNWVRTALWTARTVGLAAWLLRRIS